jgi:hypothetical protein
MIITDRIRSPAHMRYIGSLPCSVPGCRREPVDVHHLTCSPEGKARGLKAGDNYVVPLCHGTHHVAEARDGVHRAGNERTWWAAKRIDPIALAERLWRQSPAYVPD